MNREASYTDMLRRHRPLVWRMCMRRARGNRDACLDLVQEVSLSLWEHYGDLRQGASLLEERAWVFWHARTVLDHLHRRHHVPTQPIDVELSNTLPASDGNTNLDDLVSFLPPDDCTLVRMRVEGYNAAEIAETLCISRDSVYQRLHRIITKLKEEQYGKQ